MSVNLSYTKEIIIHNKSMLDSFKQWLGHELIERINLEKDAEILFNVGFAVVSHGTEKDPIFKYGNKKALELFEMGFEEFIKMPSRNSAEPMHQKERTQFMKQVTENGFVSNYEGVRISKNGKRFKIQDAIVWNVIDENKNYCGQAATFGRWEYI